MSLFLRSGLFFTLLLLLVAALPARQTYALPPAGSDVVQVTARVSLTSRLGQESIYFIGSATIERGEPYVDAGVAVVDLEMTELTLAGESITGLVTITQSTTLQSLGEIRSNQSGSDWPASAYIDVFVEIGAPASPGSEITVHNATAFHVLPMYDGSELPISSWPPTAIPWQADFATCVSLLPILPKGVCVTELSMTMSATGAEVGGFAELPGVVTPGGGAPVGGLWLLGPAGLAVLAVVWVARRRFAATAEANFWPQ